MTTTLPIQCSSHPLDSSISHQDIYMIQSSFYHASDQGEEQFLSYNGNPIPLAHNSSFTDLLTFNSPINDSIIQHVLHILHLSNSSYKYLDTNFSSSLLQKGWYYAYQKFFLHENSSRYAHSTKVKPTLCSDIILIAFFVQASHLVVIVRRFIRGIVHFFYTDDLNSLNTYDLIWSLISTSNTSELFHPSDAVWIKVHAFTYVPHSNECGPRTLLALLTIATHPTPNENILLPFMHSNLAQTCRWWLHFIITSSFFFCLYESSIFSVWPGTSTYTMWFFRQLILPWTLQQI